MTKVIFFLTALLAGLCMNAQDLSGDWHGTLSFQGTQLPVIFHFSETENELNATMDSPSQAVFGVVATSAKFQDSVLNLELANGAIKYYGVLKTNGNFEGDFKQGGAVIPLVLSRKEPKKVKVNRPQDPKAPFPYQSEEVFFQNVKAGIQLAGTLTFPKGKGKFPAVILISGSGAQDRNEEIVGHKPFLVISDYLTRNGIAVLRFDERGVGESEGDFATATTTDFATDVEAALNFLKTKKQIDQGNIGLIGHSEGGIIAPLLASKSSDVNFIVMLAGPGLPGMELMLSQKAAAERAGGANEMQIAMARKPVEEAYKIILASEAGPELTATIQEHFKKAYAGAMSENQIVQFSKQITTPWWVKFLKNDPSVYLKKVNVPVLAMNGSKDVQVPADENLSAIEAELTKGGNKNVTIKKFKNLNHLFQESETGLPSEYGKIEQTFSAEAMEFMTQWILGQVN